MDDFEDRLLEGLSAAVPEPPATCGWAEKARDRHRRRTTWLAGTVAAVVAIVVAGIVVPTTLLGQPAHPNGGPATAPAKSTRPTAHTAPDSALVLRCHNGAVNKSEQPPDGVLPDGAVAARLCTADNRQPNDALTSGVDSLVRFVNQLPKAPSNQTCTLVKGPTYRLLFGYADGATYSIKASLVNCHTVDIGAVTRDGSYRLLDTFADLLWTQRWHAEPRSTPAPARLSCPKQPDQGTGSFLPISPRQPHLVQATLCLYESNQPVAVPLTPKQIGTLSTDLPTHTRHKPQPYAPTCPPGTDRARLILVQNAWGTRSALNNHCGAFQIGISDRYWLPSDTAHRMLQSLLPAPGTVRGRMVAFGGPGDLPGEPPRPVVGSVTIVMRDATGAVTTRHANLGNQDNGQFRFTDLVPGRYQIIGHTPDIGDHQYLCRVARSVVIPAGKTVTIQLTCPKN